MERTTKRMSGLGKGSSKCMFVCVSVSTSPALRSCCARQPFRHACVKHDMYPPPVLPPCCWRSRQGVQPHTIGAFTKQQSTGVHRIKACKVCIPASRCTKAKIQPYRRRVGLRKGEEITHGTQDRTVVFPDFSSWDLHMTICRSRIRVNKLEHGGVGRRFGMGFNFLECKNNFGTV